MKILKIAHRILTKRLIAKNLANAHKARLSRSEKRAEQAKIMASLREQLDEEKDINPLGISSEDKRRTMASYLCDKYGNQSAEDIYDRWQEDMSYCNIIA